MRKVLVCGGSGFIGTHLIASLQQQECYVVSADIKQPEFGPSAADEFYQVDLRDPVSARQVISNDIDTVYQLAADMGGASFIFTGENDADIMHNSATINLNVLDSMVRNCVPRVFYSSSACIYPARNQVSADHPNLKEESAYPAEPDSEYGWEKLFSERLYKSYAHNYGLDIRIARLHNVFGPLGTWHGGREKAPAALCRKVAMAESGGVIEVWGPGRQTRSFLYIDECIDGINRLMNSTYTDPINLGSARIISINNLVQLIANIANKEIHVRNVDGPMGVMGRVSDNTLIQQVLGWQPPDRLEAGLTQLYHWIVKQLQDQ